MVKERKLLQKTWVFCNVLSSMDTLRVMDNWLNQESKVIPIMELSSTMRKMVRVRKIGQMDLRTIKDSTRTVNMDQKACINLVKEVYTKESLKTENSRVEDSFQTMLRWCVMMVSGNKTKCMGTECTSGMMVGDFRETIWTIKNMVSELTCGLMVECIMVCGRMAISMVKERSCYQTCQWKSIIGNMERKGPIS